MYKFYRREKSVNEKKLSNFKNLENFNKIKLCRVMILIIKYKMNLNLTKS